MRKTANWIITFDDGPLPADKPTWESDELELLGPLQHILDTLAQFQPAPITAVFYLRGPQFPWVDQGLPAPSNALLAEGTGRIVAAGHFAAVHCYSHNPDLWRTLLPDEANVKGDLDQAAALFSSFGQPLTRVVRVPYGAATPAVETWAREWAEGHGFLYHEWALDMYDWLHHPDCLPPLYVNDPEGHRAFSRLHVNLYAPWEMAPKSREKDVLLHVSERTAEHLPALLDHLVCVSEVWGCRPRFEIPATYVNQA